MQNISGFVTNIVLIDWDHRPHTQKNKWHQNGSLGHCFIVCKTGPFGALFWCHFVMWSQLVPHYTRILFWCQPIKWCYFGKRLPILRGHHFPPNMIFKEKMAPFLQKWSRFPKWCPKGAVSVLYNTKISRALYFRVNSRIREFREI